MPCHQTNQTVEDFRKDLKVSARVYIVRGLHHLSECYGIAVL